MQRGLRRYLLNKSTTAVIVEQPLSPKYISRTDRFSFKYNNTTIQIRDTLEHFEHRMRERAVKEDTKEINNINNILFQKRLELARRKESPPFEMIE